MRLAPSALLAMLCLVASSAAVAADKCPRQPRANWVPIDRAISKAESLGYEVREVEPDDGCWKIKGFDRNGAQVKLYLDPVSAEVVAPAAAPARP